MLALLREIVYIRLLIPFCFGIISFVFLPHLQKQIVLIVFAFCACSALFLHYLIVFRKLYKYHWVAGVAVHLLFFLAGYLLAAQRAEIEHTTHFSRQAGKNSELLLQVEEPLAETEKTYKTICKVIAVRDSGRIMPACGKVQVYFRKDSSIQLQYGDRIVVANKTTEINPPENPGEFNYKRFMAFRQIYHQAFLNTQDWEQTGNGGGNLLIASVLDLRMHLLHILKKYVKAEESYSVAASLILGMREKMDDDLVQAYSSTGTIHVLAVSGLHVAMMFKIFGLMLFFLDKNSSSKVTKAGIIIALIWGYAVLTGLSPSVLRAAVMFTFLTFGTSMKRTSNIYNLVACSAFVLLLYNPYYIMEIGFQLSYLAVVGIILLQRKVYPLYFTKVWIVDKAWLLISITIIAQLATFPLVLLNFYQFPVYFLISNMIVIPLSELTLMAGVSLLLLFWVPGLNVVLGLCLEQLLRVMNTTVVYIDSLPFAVLQGITINTPQSWLIYISFLAAVGFIYWKRNELLFAALGGILLVLAWNVIENVQQAHQQRLVVYSVSKSSAIDFISGTEHVFIADSTLIQDDRKMSFQVKPNWWKSGLSAVNAEKRLEFNYPFVHRDREYVQFLDRKILLLDKVPERKPESGKLTVDYVILTGNAKVKLEELVKIFNFRLLIFDSSNHHSKVRAWTKDCAELGLAYYDVNKSGAYVEDL